MVQSLFLEPYIVLEIGPWLALEINYLWQGKVFPALLSLVPMTLLLRAAWYSQKLDRRSRTFLWDGRQLLVEHQPIYIFRMNRESHDIAQSCWHGHLLSVDNSPPQVATHIEWISGDIHYHQRSVRVSRTHNPPKLYSKQGNCLGNEGLRAPALFLFTSLPCLPGMQRPLSRTQNRWILPDVTHLRP